MKNIRWILILSGIMAVIMIIGLIVLYVKQIDFSAEVSAAIITGCISIVAILVSTLINVYFNVQNQKLTLRDRIYEKRIEAYDQIAEVTTQIYIKIMQIRDNPEISKETKVKRELLSMAEDMKTIRKRYRFYLSDDVDTVLVFLNIRISVISRDEDIEKSLRLLNKLDKCIRHDLGLKTLEKNIQDVTTGDPVPEGITLKDMIL